MSSSNCCFLTCIQISQEVGQVVWYSHLFQNFPQFIVIHTVKGFGIVNKAETDVFLELSCFFDDPADVGNLISGSSAFSKTSLNNWKFTVHVLLKPGLEIFEHYFTSMWDECNCAATRVIVKSFASCLFSSQNIPLTLHIVQRKSQGSYNVLWDHHPIWSLATSITLFPTISLLFISRHTAYLIPPGINQTCTFLMISGPFPRNSLLSNIFLF